MTASAADDRGEEAASVRRDNGLEADTFVFLGTVEADRSGELLDDLAAESIAAYAVGGESAERLYVDHSSIGYARALLRRSGAAVTDEDKDDDDADDDDADDDDTEDSADEDDDSTVPAADDDAAWEKLVADFDRTGDDADPPWPDAEGLADDADSEDGDGKDTAGKEKDEAGDEPRTVGKNRAKVTVVELDTDDEDDTESADDDHYVKPDPPSLPKGDIWTKGAWVLMLTALAYPIAGLILDWDMPGWSIALAVVAFIAGIVVHVVRMRNPHDGPDSDDGAVV